MIAFTYPLFYTPQLWFSTQLYTTLTPQFSSFFVSLLCLQILQPIVVHVINCFITVFRNNNVFHFSCSTLSSIVVSFIQYNAYDSCYEESDLEESSDSDFESNLGFNYELGSGSDSKSESKFDSDSESDVTKLGVDLDQSVQPSSPKVQDEGSKQNDVDQEETALKNPYKG